jgi:SNF2 family DNA or RNA helicase
MIKVEVTKKGKVALHFNASGNLFNAIKNCVKEAGFRWNPTDSSWEGPVHKFDGIRGALEDLDVLEIDPAVSSAQMREGAAELIVSQERVLADYSLLHFPPIQGKPPYENFQRIDIAKGLSRNRYAYFLGMGTGKSYIASALIAHYYVKWKSVGKIVLLTTSIGVRNLYHELFKFIKDLPREKVAIADATNRDCFNHEVDIILMSYNSFRLVCNHYKKQYKITAAAPRKPFLPLEEWTGKQEMMLLLDESHSVAIPSSQQSHLAALHSPFFKYRYLFTGTPADKPEKLYNQLKILDPTLTHRLSYTDWLETYAEIGTRFSKYDVRSWKRDKLEELNRRVTASYGVYRNSEDIIDLPPHYIKKIYLNMSRQQRSIYEAFIVNTLEELREHGNSSTQDIVNRFPYMMLAVENPLLLEKHIDKFDDRLASKVLQFQPAHMEKISVLRDILEEQGNEKGVVWVVHPKTAEILAEEFKHLNPIVITGATEQAIRNELLEQFRTNEQNRILIANINVLNTSVTITWATWQCYVERIFGYAPYEQSTKRIYRIGQNKPVTTYIPLYNSSLDILLDRNLDSKDMLVKGLMSKDFLTQEEWAKIFNLSEDDSVPLI